MNNNMPLVSVVVPSFNHEKYLEQALNSVFTQTYSNIELIVIDDGSSDSSLAILEQLKIEHQFTLISQENSGVCKTLNRGVSLSSGKYISILASDDYWDSTKIEKQVFLLEDNNESDFCFTQAKEFDAENPTFSRLFPKKPLSGNVLNQVFLRQHVPAGSIMFSRALYSELAGFDESLKEEDWDFIIRCSAKTAFISIKEPLFFYRSHPTNIMKTRKRKEIFRQKALILSKNLGLVSPYIWLLSILIHFVHDVILKKK